MAILGKFTINSTECKQKLHFKRVERFSFIGRISSEETRVKVEQYPEYFTNNDKDNHDIPSEIHSPSANFQP